MSEKEKSGDWPGVTTEEQRRLAYRLVEKISHMRKLSEVDRSDDSEDWGSEDSEILDWLVSEGRKITGLKPKPIKEEA